MSPFREFVHFGHELVGSTGPILQPVIAERLRDTKTRPLALKRAMPLNAPHFISDPPADRASVQRSDSVLP